MEAGATGAMPHAGQPAASPASAALADTTPNADFAAWAAVAAGALGAFMATLDISVVNASLPTIQGEISATPSEGTWIGTSYLVAEIVITPLTAWLSRMLGLRRFKIYGADAIPAGEHQVRMEFTYDGGGLGKGGLVRLFVDGAPVGEGRLDNTVPLVFSADETTDLGQDTGTPVTDDFGSTGQAFNGRIDWVQIDIDEAAEDLDHLITPEERLRIAMSRQ